MGLILENKLLDNFTEYAEYVNNERAIAFYYDGLKPVMRRTLFTMYNMGLKPEGQTKKCATVVGKILEFHPHGDVGVYNALVRAAQDFSLLVPIIKGMGNFGSIDMPPAAMRYTEAKISPLGWALVEGLKDKIVPMMPNYDGTTSEPAFLPVPFPYLLVNGTSGIGVGMAASIPSHNLEDVINMTSYYILHPEATTADLLSKLKGPDFSTGCELVNKNEFLSIYESGSGSFKMRAKFTVTGNQIKATNLPYRVSGAKILEQLTEAQNVGEATFIKEVVDLTSEEEVVLVYVNTKDIDKAIHELCRLSDLEKSFSLDFSVVKEGPGHFNLINFVQAWVETHKELNYKRLNQEKQAVEDRLHILSGLLRATRMMDEVIKTIRNSEDRAEARTGLVSLGFSLLQTEAILEMKLARLTKLNEVTLNKEVEELEAELRFIINLLNDAVAFNNYLVENMAKYKTLSTKRRSDILENVFPKPSKEKSRDFSVVFVKNKRKAMISDGFNSNAYNSSDNSTIYLVAGKDIVPIKSAKDPVIADVWGVIEPNTEFVLHFSEDGYVKKTKVKDLKVSRRAVITSQDKVVAALLESKEEKRYIVITLNDGKKLQFFSEEVNATGRNARGVIAVKLVGDQKVVSVDWSQKQEEVPVGRNKKAQ